MSRRTDESLDADAANSVYDLGAKMETRDIRPANGTMTEASTETTDVFDTYVLLTAVGA